MRELFQVQLNSEQGIIGLPVHFIMRNSPSKQLTIPEIFLFGSFWREPSKAANRRVVQDLERTAIACTVWGDLFNRPVYGFVTLGNVRE
jgi:hypothetical protein